MSGCHNNHGGGRGSRLIMTVSAPVKRDVRNSSCINAIGTFEIDRLNSTKGDFMRFMVEG